jgi:hypothetical protein
MMNPLWLWRYGFAILCVGLAVLARLLLTPVMGDRHLFPGTSSRRSTSP